MSFLLIASGVLAMLLLQTVDTGSVSQSLIIIGLVGGPVATLLTQLAKTYLDKEGRFANAISIAVSTLIAIGAMALTGELKFTSAVAAVSTVYAVANIVYRQLVAKEPNKPVPGAESPAEKIID